MKQAKYKKEKAEVSAASWHIKRRLREGLLIVTIAFSLFLLLALITYHSSDPSWSNTGMGNRVANLGGYVGAWLADILLYIFGYIAYIFPLMLAYIVWTPSADDDEQDFTRGLFLLRLSGFMLVLVAGSGMAQIYFVSHYLPTGAGGILGDLLGNAMVGVLNYFGSGLILFAALLVGITLYSGLSWIQVVELLGRGVLLLSARTVKLFSRLISRDYDDEEYVVAKKAKVEPKISARPLVKPKRIQINNAEAKTVFQLGEQIGGGKPSLDLLDMPESKGANAYTREQLEAMSSEVELRLRDFGIDAHVVAVHPGPVITRFELQLAAGTKVSKVTGLVKDLARSLSVISVRVVEIIPGKSVIGLELPNDNREVVRLREILSTKQYRNAHSPLTLALGKDIAGHPVIVDLSKMPHLLVAGTTGSGKSVGLNAILLSLLYKYSADDVRMILIDPKMLELSVYDGIPHLLTPVVTNVKEAANALRWCVAEMERRYKLMASLGVRNIIGYNNKVKDAVAKGAPLLDPLWESDGGEEQPELEELPYIVVLADEFADMMMVVGKKIEELIARIAQKARAAGIHLILATQRPSVDVITGLIKANIPTRIAFQVSSRVDSRTILDQIGAEQLLGSGDMLYLPPGTVVPVRVHGAFVADEEVHKVVKDLKRREKPDYINEITEGNVAGVPGIDAGALADDNDDAEQDEFYDRAVAFVLEGRRVSISSIQRKFKIGYNRAARIVEAMEAAGLVSPMQSNGSREILVPGGE